MDNLNRFIEVNRLLRSVNAKSRDAADTIRSDGIDAARAIIAYVRRDTRALIRLWPKKGSAHLYELERNAIEDTDNGSNLWHIVEHVIPVLEDELDDFYSSLSSASRSGGIEVFMHPAIIRSSYHHYRTGHYRDAVFNAIVAVFDLIRDRTDLDDDGASLVGKVFSLEDPFLVLDSLENDSGKNQQKGFIQMLQGAYLGIRNPKAHLLNADLTETSAVQYLVFASLLARRVEEARVGK